MEPMYDVTREQSEENFRNHSFLTKTEVLYALDAWIDKVKRNMYDIQISDAGKLALRKALSRLRESLLAKEMPALAFYGRRYVLDIFDNCVQCGYEVFDDHELFDDDGSPVPWALSDEEAKELEEKGVHEDDEPKFYIVSRIPIPLVSIEQWAKDNGVKVATARQWASRGRIHACKDGRDLKVSPIQYTPAAFAASKATTSRFSGFVKTEAIKERFPFLFDEIVDIAILPQSDKNVFMVGRNGEGAVTATTESMPFEDRLSLIDALLEIGLKEHGYLRSPIGEAEFDPAYRFTRITCPRESEVEHLPEDMKVNMTITGESGLDLFSRKGDNPVIGGESPTVDIKVTGKDLEIGFTGYLMHRYETAEIRLLKNIFGEHPVDALVTDVLKEAGVKEVRNYPWDDTVLLLTGITVKGEVATETMALILRSLPYMMKKSAAVRPTSMILHFSTKDGVTATNEPKSVSCVEDAAKDAGFGTIYKKKGVTAFHAYVGTDRIMRPKKEPAAE